MVENPKISIQYDGAYSDRLNWRTDRLAEFANRGDLRTFVHVVTGEEMDRPQVSVLGDKLAWKNILSTANPLSKPASQGQPLEVFHSQTEGTVDATVVINHQIILEMVKRQNEKQVTPEAYVGIINSVVKRGLQSVLVQEKSDLFKYTGGIMGSYIAGGILLHVMGRIQSEALGSALLEPSGIGLVDAFGQYVYWVGKTAELAGAPTAAVIGIFRYMRLDKEIKHAPNQYLSSVVDMNPIKYPSDIARGVSYLRREGKSLVELED